MSKEYVDSDGHVMENERELNEFVEQPFQRDGFISIARMLPSLDGFHTPSVGALRPGTFDPSTGPERWIEFLDKTGLNIQSCIPHSGWLMARSSSPIGLWDMRGRTTTGFTRST
jgi:hypothetical protein